jgi:MerR family transcriptional regulator, light-induced transcriptional regulator
VSDYDEPPGLSIGDIANRGGVAVGTLRMWESRYGFPAPERLPSGHRRYSERDLEQVQSVVMAREEGLPLAMAIDRARLLAESPRPSVYGALRERFPHLHPHVVSKPALIRITHAIEDECRVRSQRPVLLGCFQRERFYRDAEPRWRELSRGAECAIVLADFARRREPADGPIEVPIPPDDPLIREWAVVCDAAELPACLIAWERPGEASVARRFEAVWTVEPEVVREAARMIGRLAGRWEPDVLARTGARLAERPGPVTTGHLRATVELATRMALYAAAGS